MIGIFDSGIGGLSVVREIFKQLPDYQIIYFGDTARCPYGNRGKEIIEHYAEEDARFLIKQGAKIIVIACNTASAVAYKGLKKKISLPLLEIVTPAVEQAVTVTRNKKIGVLGTRATVDSGIYERKIREKDPEIEVFSHAAPLLVPLVEEDWLKKPETKRVIRRYLLPLKKQQIDTLILACTHYPFLTKLIKSKLSSRVKIIDPAYQLAEKLKLFLAEHPEIEKQLIRGQESQFYVSDLTPKFKQLAGKWLDKKIHLEQAKI